MENLSNSTRCIADNFLSLPELVLGDHPIPGSDPLQRLRKSLEAGSAMRR